MTVFSQSELKVKMGSAFEILTAFELKRGVKTEEEILQCNHARTDVKMVLKNLDKYRPVYDQIGGYEEVYAYADALRVLVEG